MSATVEKPLRETLLDEATGLDNFDNSYREAYQEMLTKSDQPHLKAVVRVILKLLNYQ